MDSLPSPFTIEIDGNPIAKVDGTAEDRTHAKIGKEAAVFELKNSRLQCDGWILARSKPEDRSFLPKRVMWFKAESDAPVHTVTASQDGDSYQLKFASMCSVEVFWLYIALADVVCRRRLDGGER
jgi:hypothetical protein